MRAEVETATLSGAVEHAIEFAREAWREVWAALAIQAMGVALFYFAFQAPVRFGAAFAMVLVGLTLALAASPPAAAALYRLSLGGAFAAEVGEGGLQWNRTESNLGQVWLLFALLLIVIWFPLSIAAGLALWLFRDLGSVSLGLFGHLQIGFMVAAAILALGAAGWSWLLLRLSLASVASISDGRVMLFDAWPLTAGRTLKIGLAWLVLHLPTAVSWGLALLLTLIEAKATGVQALPLPEAIGTALVIGAVSGFMQTPLTIGLFSYFYRPRPAETASPLRFAEGL